jgi:hypothetical protein
MQRVLVLILATVAALGLLAGPAAAKPIKPDTDCLRAGQAALRSLEAFPAAARGEVNYALFDNTGGTGDIRTDLGDEAFLPLATVFQLHLRSPELFSWCD